MIHSDVYKHTIQLNRISIFHWPQTSFYKHLALVFALELNYSASQTYRYHFRPPSLCILCPPFLHLFSFFLHPSFPLLVSHCCVLTPRLNHLRYSLLLYLVFFLYTWKSLVKENFLFHENLDTEPSLIWNLGINNIFNGIWSLSWGRVKKVRLIKWGKYMWNIYDCGLHQIFWFKALTGAFVLSKNSEEEARNRHLSLNI